MVSLRLQQSLLLKVGRLAEMVVERIFIALEAARAAKKGKVSSPIVR